MFKILIIEDEALIAVQIKNFLTKKGLHVVGYAATFAEAYELFIAHKPELLICDILLAHNESGIDIVNALRKEGCFEALYLTSYSDERTLQKAFASKPLTYITKPFKEIDIYTAVMLCYSKLQETKTDTPWHYDINTKILRHQDEILSLSKQESELFHLCYLRRGHYVSKELIENALWNEKDVSSATKRGLFHRLCKKVGKEMFECHSLYGCRLIWEEMTRGSDVRLF